MLVNPEKVETVEAQLRQACADLTRALNAGQDCPAESLFSVYPSLASDADCAIELIYTEFAVREQLGQHPSVDDYYARFPQWRDRLEHQFGVHNLLGKEAGTGPSTLDGRLTVETADDDSASPAPEIWLDHYERLEEVGRGAMGVVYKARQASLNRIVALKMVVAGEFAAPERLARFRREAESMARLRHPNVVHVYAVGEKDRLPFFTMEYVDGGNLARKIAGVPQPPRQAAECVQALAGAVCYAHQQNLIHRDLKPSNVVLTADGTPKITDFGLAKVIEDDTGQTQSGELRGTPCYMSPEQAAGRVKDIGPLTDIYGLGAILYELLTGRPPFKGKSQQETLRLVVEAEPVPPRKLYRGVDSILEAICLKCLEKNPLKRYRSAKELADDLGRWLRGERTVARPRSWVKRVRRFTRRHVGVLALLAFAMTVATVAVAVNYYGDPVRGLERILHQLQQGKKVTLIGETGKPVWFQWRTDDTDSKIALGADGTLSVQSWNVGLLELLPDPQRECYQFRVEVRHDQASAARGAVGIYCSYSKEVNVNAAHVHCFCGLNFAERLLINVPESAYRVHFFSWLYPEAVGQNRVQEYSLARKPIPPLKNSEVNRWRVLTLNVTPHEIKAAWDGQWIGAVSPDGLGLRHKIAKQQNELLPNGIKDGSNDVNPPFSPRGGLGIYVYRATASFRNAVVEPLPDEH
jgi:serine/threonine-protein kinase